MKIVINHLTRMKPGFICVAGIDPRSLDHVRPVLGQGQLRRTLIRSAGGIFGIGTTVDLGPTRPVGQAPEVEDTCFDPSKAKGVSDFTRDSFWELLKKAGKRTLQAVFGPELQEVGKTLALDEGCGSASLGVLVPKTPPALKHDFGKIKARIDMGDHYIFVPVTDLRLYEDDQRTPRLEVVRDLSRRIRKGVPAILSVGVSRPWAKQGENKKRHWLQVNNVHLEDDPLWQG